jgi:hypothetical protein
MCPEVYNPGKGEIHHYKEMNMVHAQNARKMRVERVLIDEFNIQVYADGRIDWDRLDSFLKDHIDLNGLEKKIAGRISK